MADPSNSTDNTTAKQQISKHPPGPDNPNPSTAGQPGSSVAPPSAISSTTAAVPVQTNPNLNNSQLTPPQPTAIAPPAPQIQPFLPSPLVSTVPPSFRPAAPPVPIPTTPQFSPIPNHNIQNPGGQGQVQVQVQPPGVMMHQLPSSGSVSSVQQMMLPQYGQLGQQPMRMYAPMPNGYQMAGSQVTMSPAGILRYAPPPYASMLRPAYPQRPLGAMGMIPTLPRPPTMGIRGPVIPTIIRPAIVPAITPTENPQTTVYVGKIASTAENEFMLSLLQLCGPVKSWKRAQDPTTGALKGFGFCEFESAEGVLRALRLLSKLSVDGQELMLNVDKATRKYLDSYVVKKKENLKNSKASEGAEKEKESGSGLEKSGAEDPKEASKEGSKEAFKEGNKDEADKENNDHADFGLVSNEDKEADKEASEKLTSMIEERLKNKPLPPPPPPPLPSADGSGKVNSELAERSRDGDSDVDAGRNDAAEDRNDEEMTSNGKPSSEHEKPETSSPDRSNRRSRDRDRDMKREKERELERYEREREQERAKREREREYKIREDERRYRARLKEWESREKEKERARKQEREREKEREQDRKYEIMDQESDDGYSKKRKYKSSGEEREERKRRLREKEEDMEDRIKEEEEIAEAKMKAEKERELQKEQQKHALELLSSNVTNLPETDMFLDESTLETKIKVANQTSDSDLPHVNDIGNGIIQNGMGEDSVMGDTRQSNNVSTTKKLGFGLVGSGKRTNVPSVFHEEDEDAQKEKKMRPLVPIDYSTEELQAVGDTNAVAPSSNLAAAAEFAKRIGNSKEERSDSERERGRRTHDRSSHRDRDRNVEETNRTRDESRKEPAALDKEKVKTPDNKKLMDAKQLIDTIPKTKEELFLYEINWAIYDKNGLHERMRPWISKKITEFLGEEETTLVDYIVSSTQEHVTADEMLERLQSILDDEAEMFVLKMWRMLIFEIKKVETGLAGRSKA